MAQSKSIQTETAEQTITQDDIETFSELSGDKNPLHLDDDFAEDTLFGETIAHGALVNSLISAALSELPGTVIYVNQNTEFRKPVYPEETLTSRVKLETKNNGEYVYNTGVENEDGQIVASGTATVLIQ